MYVTTASYGGLGALCVCATLSIAQVVKDASSSEQALQKALMLVKFLKSEYALALRSNDDGHHTTEWSTCAATTESSDVTTSPPLITPTMTSPPTQPSRQQQATPHPYRRSGFKSHRPSRQKFPAIRRILPLAYYYYDRPMRRFYANEDDDYGVTPRPGYWRRFDYNDPFGEHPNETRPTATTAPRSITTSSATVPTTFTNKPTAAVTLSSTSLATTSESTISAITSTESTTSTIITFTKTATRETTVSNANTKLFAPVTPKSSVQPKTNRKPPHHKKATSKHSATTSQTVHSTSLETTDPILSMVVSEILNEMEDNNPKTQKTRLTHSTTHLSRYRTAKSPGTPLTDRPKILATMKIHLALSTRYPIPLPENHAFCFTNPKSALCRTFIG